MAKRPPADDPFAATVRAALAALPAEFRERMGNVAIEVADWPTAEQLAGVGLGPDDALYGLFEGVPLPDKEPVQAPQLYPDRVTLFRGPLAADFPEPRELQEEIRITLVHELGHYFGFSEDDLAEHGYL